jgi:hypothetical protein
MDSNQAITLYHGSVSLFDAIDASKGKPFKDFGRGFYTTRSRKHAVNLACRNRDISKRRAEIKGEPFEMSIWLYEFEFPTHALTALSIKEFHEPNHEWVRFVAENRRSRSRIHGYDMVIGPTADDSTLAVINGYWSGLYGDIASDKAIDTLLSLIEPDRLPIQYYFAHNRAVEYLVPISREELI